MQLFFFFNCTGDRQYLTSQLLHLHATDHTKTIKYSNFRTCLLFLSCLKIPDARSFIIEFTYVSHLTLISKSSTELIRLKPILLSSSLQLCLPNALRVLGVKDTSNGEQPLLSAVECLPMISSVNNRIQDSLPRITSN